MSGTLGYHRQMAAAVFGADSPAVAYLDEKIAESPHGEDEEVFVAEEQLVYLLTKIHIGDTGPKGADDAKQEPHEGSQAPQA